MSKYSVIKKGDDTELAIKGFPSSGKVTERRMVNGSLFIKTDMTKQWPQGFIPVELVNPLFTAPSSAMVKEYCKSAVKRFEFTKEETDKLNELLEGLYEHYQSNGWRSTSGRRLQSWTKAVDSFVRIHYYLFQSTKNQPHETDNLL
jgi:hypothetical protein